MNTARIEKAQHDLKVGTYVTMFAGGVRFYGRVVGFFPSHGSGLTMVDAIVDVASFDGRPWPTGPVCHGALKRLS